MENLQADKPSFVDGQVRHVKALFLQDAARIKHALVLCLRSYHVVLALAVKPGDALDSHIIRFSRSARKDDFLWVCLDERCNLLCDSIGYSRYVKGIAEVFRRVVIRINQIINQ